jgi:hypothetical protein
VSFVVNRLWFSILQQKLWLNRYNSFRKSATQGLPGNLHHLSPILGIATAEFAVKSLKQRTILF